MIVSTFVTSITAPVKTENESFGIDLSLLWRSYWQWRIKMLKRFIFTGLITETRDAEYLGLGAARFLSKITEHNNWQ